MMQQWFSDVKLGVFIHWGVYAVGRRGSESWPLFRGRVGYDEYLAEMDRFDASTFDPDVWAKLIERSGAKYAVLTTKHHDGVALWPTKQDAPSIPNQRGLPDLVAPFVEAIRCQRRVESGVKMPVWISLGI